MPVQDLLKGLDNEQEKAVTLETNGVASAGAGSGKTKVLASRYAWLVTEKNLKPDEILTLTFTNKAVSEMYSRIYRYLLEQSNAEGGVSEKGRERAAAAVREFHKARISTLDSFSAGVARTAAARYGLSPDFSSDDTSLRDLAREAALTFVLDNREAQAIRGLLVDHKIRKLAEEIFAQVVLRYSPVSSPLELDKHLSKQKETIIKVWGEKTRLAEEITGKMTDALRALAAVKKSIGFTDSLGDILLKTPPPSLPDIAPLLETGTAAETDPDADMPPSKIRKQIEKYFDYYSALVAVRLPGRYGEVYAPLVEYFRALKGKDEDGLYQELESIANYAFNFGLCAGLFTLIEKFQNEFNAKKRETGLLSFNDIARLAADALRDQPDIRKVYKDSLKMIMIDEFQDNNSLQRDLIYLLAENPDRAAKGIAPPEELEKNRMFFVGDEKQSIYRFRGADVAVFRSLGKDLFGNDNPSRKNSGGIIELKHNYRSRPALISAFNRIFGGLDEKSGEETGNSGGVFPPPGDELPDYEAVYNRVYPAADTGKENEDPRNTEPLTHFCFLNGEDLPEDNSEGIKSQDLEAAFIAGKIRGMVEGKEKIPKRTDRGTEWVECTWADFAVLERAYTHQSSLEKYFREFAVPYNTDRPSGLFSEAPIMDLRAYLRLLVYPEDRISYAALLRSPFTRLSDLTLSVCMLNKNAEPFAEENEEQIPNDDLELYRLAGDRYRNLREASRSLPITELLSKLWFEEGYRFETLWPESAQVYGSLFDLFFSMASDAEKRGKNLAEFIEYIEDLMNLEEKPDDKDIPGEGESGVRLMSIHKSKGLEFPVVFIFDCAHSGNIRAPSGLVNYHEEFGLILNIPQADGLPIGGNYFRKIFQEEEKAKDIAELRRLLYVAMTRAECKLFLTFTLPAQTKEEKKIWNMAEVEFTEETIRARLNQYDGKHSWRRDNFLKLLAKIIPACPPPLCVIETIPVLSRRELSVRAAGKPKTKNLMSLREAALAAETFYENAKTLKEGEARPSSIDASSLHYKPQSPPANSFTGEPHKKSPLDGLLEKAGLSSADFGSLVHAVLEDRLGGRAGFIPHVIRSRVDDEKTLAALLEEAASLADGFLASQLGKRWAAASSRESEFSVITSAMVKGKAVAIAGKIDLLFEEDDETVVIDFKTDRIENPEDHYGQLAAYSRAAGDIFGKPVSAWLFYLRSGRAVEITEAIRGLSVDELAEAAVVDTANAEISSG